VTVWRLTNLPLNQVVPIIAVSLDLFKGTAWRLTNLPLDQVFPIIAVSLGQFKGTVWRWTNRPLDQVIAIIVVSLDQHKGTVKRLAKLYDWIIMILFSILKEKKMKEKNNRVHAL
jgi:hypothetical protein